MAEFQITSDNLTPLKGKVVLITGSTSGIGKATVTLCLELGAKVIAGDINSPDPSAQDAPSNDSYLFVQTNVTEWTSIRNLFITGYERFGRIDHVFANAGIGPRSNFLEETFEEAEVGGTHLNGKKHAGDKSTPPASSGLLTPPNLATIQVNLIGVINTVRLAAYYLRQGTSAGASPDQTQVQEKQVQEEEEEEEEEEGKSIVLTASASSFQNFGATDYTTAKHAVLGIMRGLVSDLQKEQTASGKVKMRMNAIAPSWTATGLVPRDVLEALGARVQEPEVVAKSVVMLFNDPDRHGDLIYSWAGRYWEINNAEGGMLKTVKNMLPDSLSEEDVVENAKGAA